MTRKVLIPTKLDKKARELLSARGTYEVVQDDAASLPELAARHPDTYALIIRSEKVTPAVMDSLPKLKVVARAGAGYDNIDVKYARSRGIDVMNTPGANSNAVAEEVIALILADARHIIAADASARSGKWEKNSFMGRELTGKTVGIVGLGNIGQLVAARLAGFECILIGYDPLISGERASRLNVSLVGLEEVFARSDYVTLHLPENQETKGMIGERLISLMRERASIVNCARAGIVDEAAIRKFKPVKKLRFLNDVYAKDAEGPKSVADIADIMLPHLGASTAEANLNAARRAAEELIDYDEKGVTSFVVNRDIPEGLDQAYCRLANVIARLCEMLLGPDAKLKSIETSAYGSLSPYANWLIVPVVAAIEPGFDISLDFQAARRLLEEMGVDYVDRQTDPAKGYENSFTVDLTGQTESGDLKKTSVRGTVAEGHLMVSRINEFDKLYFEPLGNTAFVLYNDRPGIIGAIGLALAEAGINIEEMRHSHDKSTNRSLAILKVNKRVSPEMIRSIAGSVQALSAFYVELG